MKVLRNAPWKKFQAGTCHMQPIPFCNGWVHVLHSPTWCPVVTASQTQGGGHRKPATYKTLTMKAMSPLKKLILSGSRGPAPPNSATEALVGTSLSSSSASVGTSVGAPSVAATLLAADAATPAEVRAHEVDGASSKLVRGVAPMADGGAAPGRPARDLRKSLAGLR